MTFFDVIPTALTAIQAHPTFAPDNNQSVMADLGASKAAYELSLEQRGYAVGVFPPTQGQAEDDFAGVPAVHCKMIVRLEIKPSQTTDWNKVSGLFVSIIDALVTLDPDPGGVKWALAHDAFELVAFDEGVLAYHIRFNRFLVMQ